MSSYAKKQIDRVVKENSSNEFSLQLVIKGTNSSTKHINISNDEAELIGDILDRSEDKK